MSTDFNQLLTTHLLGVVAYDQYPSVFNANWWNYCENEEVMWPNPEVLESRDEISLL